MTSYTWTGKDRNGKPVVEEVEANSSLESKMILEAEGFTELKLMEEDVIAAVNAGFTEKPVVFGEEVEVTVADRLKHRDKPRATFFRLILESLQQDWKLYCLLTGLLALEIYRGEKVFAIILGLGLVAWLTFRTWMALPTIYYAKITAAREWYRWNELLELVGKAERIGRHHIVKIPLPELAHCRARALAGLGKLPEALAELKRFENQPGLPGWLYKTQVAGLYVLIKQHDKALEYYRLALAEQPIPVIYMDYADALLRYKKDTVGARAAMAEADKAPVADLAIPYRMRSRGILAYLEGDYTLAKSELEAGLKIVAGRHQPFKDAYLSLSKAYLSCVLARQGETAAARKFLAQAREYLVATDQQELLAECNRMVGA